MSSKNNDINLYIKIQYRNKVVFEDIFSNFPISIGRHPSNDISFPEFNWLSRQHACIEEVSDQLVLRDMQSGNGLHANGKIIKTVVIKGHQVVKIHELEITFSLLDSEATVILQQPPDLDENGDEATEIVSPEPYLRLQKTLVKSLNESPDKPLNESLGESLDEPDEPFSGLLDSPLNDSLNESLDESLDVPLNEPLEPLDESFPVDEYVQAQTFVSPTSPQVTNPTITKKETKTETRSSLSRPPLSSPKRKVHPVTSHHSMEGPSGSVNQTAHTLCHTDMKVQELSKAKMSLQVTVTWQGDIYESRTFRHGEDVSIGVHASSIYLPILNGKYHLADYDGNYIYCCLSENGHGEYIPINADAQPLQQLIPSLPNKEGVRFLKLHAGDMCVISMGQGILVYLQYIPSPRQLTNIRPILPEKLLRRTLTVSGIGHVFAILFMFLLTPKEPDIKIRNLPPRIAKLLIQKPKTPPPPPPTPVKPPEPKPKVKPVVKNKKIPKVNKKKLIKKVVRKRKIRKPRKVVVRKSKKMQRMNNRMVVKKKPPRTNIKKLGALAALGLRSPISKPRNRPVALNINPKAGGASSPKINTKGVIGTIKTKNGRLPPALGSSGIQTKGKGYGTGKGYGVQGLKGRAGSRGIAGAVQGNPKLLEVRRTEGLTHKQVMKEVNRHIAKIQGCYEKALLSAPSISGLVEYEWHITPKGRVKWAKVKRSEVSSGDVLNNCVVRVFKKMKFPVAQNGESTVPRIGFPFGRL